MKMKILILVAICLAFISFDIQNSEAGEVDILINKLVEKGVINRDDASQLLNEMQKEKAKQDVVVKPAGIDAVKEETKNNKITFPKWVENMTLSGDVRFRYQTEDVDNDGLPSRNRWRLRLRAGAESKVNDQWKAGFGLSTGSGDPRSANQTFEDEFQRPDIRVDYAYAQYMPAKDINIIVGKFKNPLWTTKDLMWDTDINPNGLSATFGLKASDNLSFFVTPAYFILEEDKSKKDDPAMTALQTGLSWKINDNLNFKSACTYYNFSNVKGTDMSVWSSKTNSVDTTGKWVYDLDSISFGGELGATISSFIEYTSFFGEYVRSDADRDNTGLLIGIKLGNKKVNELGKWQFVYSFRKLEKDGWVDWLPDNEFYNGKTGVAGNKLELVFGINKDATLGVNYYLSAPIDNPDKKDQSLISADLVLKF